MNTRRIVLLCLSCIAVWVEAWTTTATTTKRRTSIYLTDRPVRHENATTLPQQSKKIKRTVHHNATSTTRIDRELATALGDNILDLDRMQEQGWTQGQAFTASLRACQTAGNATTAWEIWQAMLATGLEPAVEDYQLLIATLTNTTDPQQAHYWKQQALTVVQQRADLPLELYHSVLTSLMATRQWKESIRLLQFLLSSSHDDNSTTHPNHDTYSAVLDACLAAHQSDAAIQIWSASLQAGHIPDASYLESILTLISRKQQWRRGLQLLTLADQHQIQPTLTMYHCILSAMAADKAYKPALALLRNMKVPADIKTYNLVLSACASRHAWKQALQVLDQCHWAPGVTPDIYTYTNAIRACAKGGQTRRALTLLQVVKDKKLPLDTYCYTAAIEACAKGKMWQRALELLDEMKAQGIQPSEVTYSVAISACGNGGAWRKALDLLNRMRQENMKIHLITYNAAITALAKAAKQSAKKHHKGEELWIKALDILKQMKADGIEPDGFSFCSAISCCGAEGRWEEALDLMETMQNGGPRPNKIAYTAAIASCGCSGQADHALRLFRQMKDQGLSADRVAYNALFSALRVAGRAHAAAELWEEMLAVKQSNMSKIARSDSSTTPDIITVTDAIGAMLSDSSLEGLERVDRVLAEAVRRGIVLRSDTLDSANEVDLSGMSLPVARAAVRYILNKLKTLKVQEIVSELTFITGVGAGKVARRSSEHAHKEKNGDAKGLTSLREYVQEILLTDFDPPLRSTVPRLAQGTVVVDKETLVEWRIQQ